MKSAHLLAAALMIAAYGTAGAQTFDNLPIDGKTYNATIAVGTFAQVFPEGFNFTSLLAATDAASELGNALNLQGVTFGCAPLPAYNCVNIYVPYEFVDNGAGTSSAYLFGPNGTPSNPAPMWVVGNQPLLWDTGDPLFGNKFWAVFTLTSAPEPATLGLLVLALAGAGFVSRKRKA